MKKLKNQNAITLIALIITIIILLILAGISISALTQTGLFSRAKQAEQLSKEKQEREINISGTHGEMKLGVKNGYICVKESSCPHKYCINQGYTSSFPIVCSFNDITIKIESSSPYEVIL